MALLKDLVVTTVYMCLLFSIVMSFVQTRNVTQRNNSSKGFERGTRCGCSLCVVPHLTRATVVYWCRVVFGQRHAKSTLDGSRRCPRLQPPRRYLWDQHSNF